MGSVTPSVTNLHPIINECAKVVKVLQNQTLLEKKKKKNWTINRKCPTSAMQWSTNKGKMIAVPLLEICAESTSHLGRYELHYKLGKIQTFEPKTKNRQKIQNMENINAIVKAITIIIVLSLKRKKIPTQFHLRIPEPMITILSSFIKFQSVVQQQKFSIRSDSGQRLYSFPKPWHQNIIVRLYDTPTKEVILDSCMYYSEHKSCVQKSKFLTKNHSVALRQWMKTQPKFKAITVHFQNMCWYHFSIHISDAHEAKGFEKSFQASKNQNLDINLNHKIARIVTLSNLTIGDVPTKVLLCTM